MHLRVSPVDDFGASLAALDFPGAEWLVHALLRHLAAHPSDAPLVTGTNVRLLRTRGSEGCPPLLLFYTFDDRAVYPLHVEVAGLM